MANRNSITWAEFSEDINITPPPVENKSVAEVIEVGDRLMKECSGGVCGWDDLEDNEKAMLSFVVNNEIDKCFPSSEEARRDLHGILTGGHLYKVVRQNLWSFVHKRGEETIPREINDRSDWGVNAYQKHLQRYPELYAAAGERHASIFQSNAVKRILKIQEGHSMVCVFITVSKTLYYAQCLQQGLSEQLDVEKLSLNVYKCMRSCLTNVQMYNTIFNFHGFRADCVLEAVLRYFNPEMIGFLNSIHFRPGVNLDDVFMRCKLALKLNNLLLLGLNIHRGYNESDKCTR
jgi:hypothetical protein